MYFTPVAGRISRVTADALIVIPRSRSRSMSSRIWRWISRCVMAPVRQQPVGQPALPWSMWAMMQKLRINGSAMGSYHDKTENRALYSTVFPPADFTFGCQPHAAQGLSMRGIRCPGTRGRGRSRKLNAKS